MSGYSSQLRTAAEAAKLAGQVILKHFGRSVTQETKTSTRDIVTEVDLEAESIIVSNLRQHYPSVPILSEESSNKVAGDTLWIVDPLDGTTNFVRGIELFSVAICLSVNSAPVVGVVYQPILDQLFTAEVGVGSFLNGTRISVSKTTKLEDFTIASNMSYADPDRSIILENIRRQMQVVAGIRLFLAIQLDLSMVARGSLDAALGYSTSPWDVAAGCALVREAGGVVTNWEGGNWTVDDRNFVASNGKDHDSILELLYSGSQ
ncbi:MAG: inositol monophosphatase [Chloroflexota bacterium]|nr:inositol monophosphatase [Chloroflexota bacterium]